MSLFEPKTISECITLYHTTTKTVDDGNSISLRSLSMDEINENQRIAREKLEEFSKSEFIRYLLFRYESWYNENGVTSILNKNKDNVSISAL